MSIISKIRNLITAGNATTGQSRDTLTEVVQDLVDGYGGGGTPTLQTKTETYTPTESVQTDTITPDPGYDGLDEVDITVNAISDTYVGSAITQRDSTDLSASGATVTAPAGYYAAAASKAVASGSAKTPDTALTVNPSILFDDTTGQITALVSGGSTFPPDVTPGYVSSGTNGTISFSGSATSQLPTQGAQTITPTGSDQSVAAGKFLTGAQTVEAVVCENLTAANIVSGVTVKIGTATDDDSVASVTGTASGGGGLDINDIVAGTAPTGLLTIDTATSLCAQAFFSFANITGVHMVQDINTTTSNKIIPTNVETLVCEGKLSINAYNKFDGAYGLKAIDVGDMTAMSNGTFKSTALDTFVIRKTDGVVPMSGGAGSVFASTSGHIPPFNSSGTGGTLYVPNSMISSYQAASNWSTLLGYTNNQIKSIESTHTDPTAPIDLTLYYADGTPISTP